MERERVGGFLLAGLLAVAVPAGASPLEKLARTLLKDLPLKEGARIAVLDFRGCDEVGEEACSIVRERLTTYLASEGRVQVVERSLLQSVVQEWKLETSGAVSSEQTHRLGELLGADAIVAGTLHGLDDGTVEANVRLIHAGTARILAAGMTTLKRTWQAPPPARAVLLAAPIPQAAVPPPRPAPPRLRPPAGPRPRLPERVEQEHLRFFAPEP